MTKVNLLEKYIKAENVLSQGEDGRLVYKPLTLLEKKEICLKLPIEELIEIVKNIDINTLVDFIVETEFKTNKEYYSKLS